MTDHQTEKPTSTPWHFWLVAAIGLIWNGYGAFLWGGTTFNPDPFLAALPDAQRAYVEGLPVWSTVTWALGVLGGLLGTILLIMRNKLAVFAFALSLIGAVVNTLVYVTNPSPPGFFNLPLTVFIIGFAILLLGYSLWLRGKGVLR